MYNEFFGFKEKPFSLSPDPRFLYLSKNHSAALTMLQYGLLNQAGFTVITGEVGCGKTTLILHLLEENDEAIAVGLINNTQGMSENLLQWTLLAFNLDYRGKTKIECYHDFKDFVLDMQERGRRTVLIIDEAQNLDSSTLEELRMLSNINKDGDQSLQFILSGQPELRAILSRPELKQFAQRIAAGYHLNPLDRSESEAYIRHRLKAAGGKTRTFRQECYEVIFRFTHGVPRLINLLCDTSLVYAYGERRKTVNAEMVNNVLRDKIEAVLANHSPQEQTFAYPTMVGQSEDDSVAWLHSDDDRNLLRELFSEDVDKERK